MDILSVYESQIASLDGDLDETVTPLHSMGHMTYTKQPTLEDEEDLIENAEEERRKNKQRLREKKMREKEFSSPAKSHDQITVAYENAQKQIDSVLGPRGKQEEDSSKKKKDSPKKSPKKKKKEKEGDGKSSEDDKPNAGAEDKTDMPEEGEENLETARERMHQLLDDAFSLVSQSRTSLGNKVDPKQSSGEDSPRSNKYNESHTSKKKQKSLSKEPSEESLPEKKHTPLFIKRTPDKYDSSGLISWDPYRAADDTALISLPGQEMNNLTSKPPAQEKVTTTTFTELSLPGSLRPNFYTTEPGEPIVITSDALSPGSNHVSQRQSSSSRRNSNSLNVRVPNNGHMQQQQQQTTYHNPSYNSREEGMSTFQEIPHSKSHLETYGRNSGNNGDYVILSEFDNEEPVAKNLNDNDLKVPNHISPRSSQLPNQDVADVISQSVRPGANPQPLINSLREELLSLSSKKLSPSSSSSSGVTTSINVPNGRNKTAPAFTVNGYGGKGYYSSGSASSGWESMPK